MRACCCASDVMEVTEPAENATDGSGKRLVLWGTYDLTKPRTRILRESLRRQAGGLVEIHADLWQSTRDKSAATGACALIRIGLRHLVAYPRLVWRYLRAPRHATVIVGYMGHLDVLVLWPFARLRGVPIVWDMFLSLYDTVVLDRALVRPRSLAARLLWALERLALSAADLAVIDTETHARRIEALFRLPSGRLAAVPVGVEPGVFPPLSARVRDPNATLRILFYGQFIPLHGIDTILSAARLAENRPLQWQLIGTGQEAPRIRAELATRPILRLVWQEWVPYEQLIDRMRDADICLGIFGTSDKAASVIPNKVFQALSAGCPIITRDSPAMRELVAPGTPGIALIPPADPRALLEAIDKMTESGTVATATASPRYRRVQAAIQPDQIAAAWDAVVARVDARH